MLVEVTTKVHPTREEELDPIQNLMMGKDQERNGHKVDHDPDHAQGLVLDQQLPDQDQGPDPDLGLDHAHALDPLQELHHLQEDPVLDQEPPAVLDPDQRHLNHEQIQDPDQALQRRGVRVQDLLPEGLRLVLADLDHGLPHNKDPIKRVNKEIRRIYVKHFSKIRC